MLFTFGEDDDVVEEANRSRYRAVSRRALLKGSLGVGAAAMIPGLACSNGDEEIFAGAVADPTTTTTAPPTTAAPTTDTPDTTAAAAEESTDDPETESADAPETTAGSEGGDAAVVGEMVIGFTYTQAAGGKNEPPYVAVWLEDAAGELAATVALWYEQARRGERWLDHLSRWYDVDLAASGADTPSVTVSSATRAPGTYTVAWDGQTPSGVAATGDYFICIEAVREDGPYSLIREPLPLSGSLAEMALPDDGELSAASVRIDA